MADPAARQLATWAKSCPAIDPSSAEQMELFSKLRRDAGDMGRVSLRLFLAKLPGLTKRVDCGASVELLAFGVPKSNFPNGLPAHLQQVLLSAADLEEYELAGAEQGHMDTSAFFLFDYYQVEKPSELGRKARVLKFFSKSSLSGVICGGAPGSSGGPATGGPATGGPATNGPTTERPSTGGPATGGPATAAPVARFETPAEWYAVRCGRLLAA